MQFNFSPSKEFAKKTKERFLAAFDVHNPVPMPMPRRTSEFVLAMRGLALVLACMAIIFGGASVYADTKNVPADNPLYPLKRLSESVQLALTAPPAKPELEASFAARRASEITDLSARHPSSTLIPHLTSDLDAAVDASIDGAVAEAGAGAGNNNDNNGTTSNDNVPAMHPAQSIMSARFASGTSSSSNSSTTATSTSPKNGRGRGDNGDNENSQNDLQTVCGTLQSFLNPSSSVVKGGFLDHSKAFQQFQDRCGGAAAGYASSTPDIMGSTAPTSTVPFHGVRGGYHGGGPGPVRRGN